MKPINPKSIPDNPVRVIGDDWMLVSAGNPVKFNTMTASWGGAGFLWNKPVVFVFIRPNRYTYEFMEERGEFTLSFFGPEYKEALKICGSASGRDTDKVALSGLKPRFTELGNPTFEQARLVLECKKLYTEMLRPEQFIDSSIPGKWYGDGTYHKMYIAEIVNAWTE